MMLLDGMPVHAWVTDHVLYGRFTRPWIRRMAQVIVRGPRETTLRLGDVDFSCPTNERYFWLGMHYEPDIARKLLGSVSSDDVIYDIGAHFGYWVVRVARRCHSVYAFEPGPDNFLRLSGNIARNGFTNVHAINAAVAAKGGIVRFNSGSSISFVSDDGKITVPALRLDDFIEGHAVPTIILIDVEGYGGECLAGFSLQKHLPRILAEIHSPVEEGAVFRQLRDAGYQIETLTRSRPDKYPYRIDATVTPAAPSGSGR